MLVIEIPQEMASEVLVEIDGERATIKGQDGKLITLAVAAGEHQQLLVTVDGMRLVTDADKGFEIAAGKNMAIRARLERVAISAQPKLRGNTGDADLTNYAVLFDGKADYGRFSRSTIQGPFTVEGKFVPLSVPIGDDQMIVMQHRQAEIRVSSLNNQTSWSFAISPNDDRVTYSVLGGEVVVGKRYHVAASYDGTRLRLFVDGHESKERTRMTDWQDNTPSNQWATLPIQLEFDNKTTPTVLGMSGLESRDRHFHGLVDELRISRGVRYTQDFIPEKRLTADTNTLALYPFNEGKGDEFHDSSGNDFHGNLYGATWVEEVVPGEFALPNYDRRFAERALSLGAEVVVIIHGQHGVRGVSNDTIPEEMFYITSLVFNRTGSLTNDDFEQLGTLSQLKTLRMRDFDGDENGLQHLQHNKKLEKLFFHGTSAISAVGLQHIGSLTHLKTLALENVSITDATFLSNLPALDDLALTGCDVSETNLAKVLPELTSLQRLWLTSTGVGNALVERLVALESLEELHLDHASINDDCFESLVRLKHLKVLGLNYAAVTATGLRQLSALPSLSTLQVAATDLSDEDVDQLSELTQLTSLDVSQTGISQSGVGRLHQALSNCSVLSNDSSDATIDYSAEHEAAKWILSVGGKLHIRTENGLVSVTDPATLGDNRFTVETADLTGCYALPEEIERQLSRLSEINYLSLSGTNVSDENLSWIADVFRGGGLDLSGCNSQTLFPARFLPRLRASISRIRP